MIGSMLDDALNARSDISHIVGVTLKFSSKPAEAHLSAVKRNYHYVKGSLDITLKYKKSDYSQLIGCTDAD